MKSIFCIFVLLFVYTCYSGQTTTTRSDRWGMEVADADRELALQTEKTRRENYGRLSDVRDQNWGFEYRSCSSFIATPASALAVLTVAWVVANEFLDGTLPEIGDLALNGERFAVNPKEECMRMMEARIKFIMNLKTVKENEEFTHILKVAFHIIKQDVRYEQINDMKKAWKLRYEAPAPIALPDKNMRHFLFKRFELI